jgi:hypothetical protein
MNNFNQVFNLFRVILIYEFLNVNSETEFQYDDLSKMILNKKFSFEDIPYYEDIKSKITGYSATDINSLKSLLDNSTPQLTSSKKRLKDDVFVETSTQKNSKSIIDNLDLINKDLMQSMEDLDSKFKKLENDINK